MEDKTTGNPLDMDVPFSPYDHTTAEVPTDESLTAFGNKPVGELKEQPGYFEGTLANLEDKNITYRLLHAGWDRTEDYTEAYKDPNFNPMQFSDKFINIRPEYQSYLLQSENEEQMDSRLKRIQHEQWMDDSVKNGSWMQWLSGSALALPTDLITYIPIMNMIKYASYGKTALNAAMRSIPSALTYGLSSSLGENLDKVNGNMHDFLTDGAIRSVFATALFSAGPLASLTGDKLALWDLQSYVGDLIKGVGYKLKVGEKGEVQGLKAYDMTGNESMNAAKVKLAQDKADSAFAKNGLFKIPYIGTAAEKVMSNSFFGSPALSMLTSPFESVRMVLDLAFDHGMITKGLEEGKPRPITFFTQMQKTLAHIRQEQNIFNALHMERNGVKSKNYVAQNLYRAGMYARQKSLEKIESEIGDRPYISPDEFMEEIQQVMHSGVSHDNAAVNDAASMFRKSMDAYYAEWRKAYNLTEDWMPPRTAKEYLMRVYDTNYLNSNLKSWVSIISDELRNQDNIILKHTQPILDVEAKIEANIANQERFLEHTNITDTEKKLFADELISLRAQKKALEHNLQNEIRNNPELHILADDWNALSHDEAQELISITKRRDIVKKAIEEQKKVISDIKTQAKERSKAAHTDKTVKTAKGNKRKAAIGEQVLEKEQAKLDILQKELDEELEKLQEMAHAGTVNRRFISQDKDTGYYIFREPNERLKLRKTYHQEPGHKVTEEEAHISRQEHAKAYYDTIMNQTAEDTINQVMGRFTGNPHENHTKQRSILIPDQILYDNKFLTKDLLSKVANYKIWLARRTHLKNTYSQVSLEGGFEPIIKDIHKQFDNSHASLNEEKSMIEEKLKDEKLTTEERKKLKKGLEKTESQIKQLRKDFNKGKEQAQFAYEKMVGISKLNKRAKSITSGIKAFNVFANLGFLPATMITDLSANGLKQGLVPFIQSGLYPTIQSLGGFLKTHDSQSLRDTAGALNLALHHIGNSTASRQMDLSTNPYLNLGRIPEALDKVAHFTSNINLTTTIDNYLQRVTSAVAQSNVIRHMMAFEKGELSKADRMWLNRYGLDPEKDAAKILAAFRKDGGGTNKLGGYQSNFWHWQDMESANKVSDAVFRSTHDTIISANALDAPIWLDENGLLNMMAPIIRGFKGWAFASLNRYLIPTLQAPDAQKLMSFALMSASAALVSPSRRMARGQSPYRDGQTKTQIVAEILMDSPQFSWMSEALNDANLISGGSLLRDLKNDKYYDRTRMGIMGPTGSNANKLFNFVDALASGNMNEHDAMGMASMIPVVNSLYGYNASQHIIQNFGLPKYRSK